MKRGKNIRIIVWRVKFGKNSRVEQAGLRVYFSCHEFWMTPGIMIAFNC